MVYLASLCGEFATSSLHLTFNAGIVRDLLKMTNL